MTQFTFKDRSAVITGAGSGIGRALAETLAVRGARLLLADRDMAPLEALATELRGRGVEAYVLQADVSRAEDIEAMAAAADRLLGGTDLLCNNAGITTPNRWRRVWEFEAREWTSVFDVNVMGIVHGIRAFVPRMIARGTPAHVLNTASIAGLISGSGSVPYGMSKVAAVRISEGLFAGLREEGHPIGVTMLCPGLVRTAIYDRSGAQPDLDAEGHFKYAPETLTAEDCAVMALDAVRDGQFYALTEDSFDPAIRARTEAILQRRNPGFQDELIAQGRA